MNIVRSRCAKCGVKFTSYTLEDCCVIRLDRSEWRDKCVNASSKDDVSPCIHIAKMVISIINPVLTVSVDQITLIEKVGRNSFYTIEF